MTTIEHLTFADIADRESTVRRRLSLPGGIVGTDGAVHRYVRVRELTGADEEALFNRDSKSDAQRVSAFLARVIESVDDLRQTIDTAFVENLSIGDRDYLLLRMRQLDLGDAVHQIVRCPSCSQKVDVDFSISEIPLRRMDQPERAYSVEIGGHRLTLRFPNGADQAAVESLATVNAAAANTTLFSRVVLDIDGKGAPSEDDVRSWPVAMRAEIAKWLDANAPGPDLFIDIACPHCGADMSYSFDLDAFFLPNVSLG